MTFAHPWAFAALAALPLLWWWHRARLRPRDVAWPSLILWKRLPAPDPAAIARHRRRADLALWLAMAGVLALVFGALGVTVATSVREPLHVGVVLDVTASARGPFEEIHQDTRAFLATLPAGSVVDLSIVPGGTWRGLTYAEALKRVDAAEATDAPGDTAAAAAGLAGSDLVAVFTDRPGPAELGAWRVHPAAADTEAVEALAVADGSLYAVVRGRREVNGVKFTIGGREPREDVLDVFDGQKLFVRPMPAEGTLAVLLTRPDGAPSNNARFWCSGSAPTRVGLAGRDFPALRRALEGAGVFAEIGGAPSIWVGEVPPTFPDAPAILIDPAKGVPGYFEVEGEVDAPVVGIPDRNAPYVRAAAAADLQQLQVAKSRKLRFLKDARVLVNHLIYQSGRTVVIAFDPSAPNSNWTRLVSFPIFWAEVAKFLRPGASRLLSTGDSLTDRDGPHSFPRAGLFTHAGETIAVNLDDPGEISQIASPAEPSLPPLDLPDKSVIRSVSTVPPAWGALAGLLLLVLSWLASRPRRP